MKNEVTHVKISIGFGKSQFNKDMPKTFKKGEGKSLHEAIQNLFNKPYNYIKQDHMTSIYREIMKTKQKLFKRKE